MKNNRKKKQINPGMVNRRIDIDSIYKRMTIVIRDRDNQIRLQKSLWRKIDKTRCNENGMMKKVAETIGNRTHVLNQLINELCQYKKTHKAMNLAYNYINKEIERINKIINSQNRIIHNVNTGKECLIDSYGNCHTNTKSLVAYVKSKQEQVNKLEKWRKIVSKYRV